MRKDKILTSIYDKKYYKKNRERILKRCKIHYNLNRDRYLKLDKIYRKNHKEEIKQRKRIYKNNRCKTDLLFKINCNLRSRIYIALKRNSKSKHTIELLGCSTLKLKQYLEKQFKPGMNWKNYGKGKNKWEIDHIKPCAKFDLSKTKEQRRCFHFTNLQPLWSVENIKKGDKYVRTKI